MQLYLATIMYFAQEELPKNANMKKETTTIPWVCNEKQVRIRSLSITFVIRKLFERTSCIYRIVEERRLMRVCAHACLQCTFIATHVKTAFVLSKLLEEIVDDVIPVYHCKFFVFARNWRSFQNIQLL